MPRPPAFTRLLPLAAVSCAVACSMAPPPSSVPALAGCYYFERNDTARNLRLPEGIRLTERPLEGWPAIMQRGAVKVALTLTGQGPADYPFGYWLLEDDGSLEVGYPAGGAILLELVPTRDRLEGTARAHGDTERFGQENETPQEMTVRLDRGACPDTD